MKLNLIIPSLKEFLINDLSLIKDKNFVLSNPMLLTEALSYKNIVINWNPKTKKNKAKLIEIVKFLSKCGRNVSVIEFERIFDDDTLLELARGDYEFSVCLRYMLRSYQTSYNFRLDYNLQEYQKIIKKVKYFNEKVNECCETDEKKIFFVLYQLATYVKYPQNFYSYRINDDNKYKYSDLYASIGRGESVCLGYSSALWKILTELNIQCNLITGYFVDNDGETVGHAWNQVCLDGVWYNIDLTDFAYKLNPRYLFKSDSDFLNHDIMDWENFDKKECTISYGEERINNLLEVVSEYPNYFKQYEDIKTK